MTVYYVTKVRSHHFIPKPLLNPFFSCLSLHSHSFSTHKSNPTSWNTTHTYVLSNPLLSLLENCKSFSQLKQIQAQMILTGLILDGFASSRLISFCAISESRNLDYCIKILNNLQNPNVFSWNAVIRGCVESENPQKGLVLYKRMLTRAGCRPDNYTYSFLFKVCANLVLSYMGFEILGQVLKMGFDKDMYLYNGIIHMLVSVGESGLAHKVFDEGCVRDLVSWNSLINGYVRRRQPREAMGIYQQMITEQVKPDEVTMIGVVSACAQLESLKLGREIHRYIEESGLNLKISLVNALMDMYVKCGDLEAGKVLFDNMRKKTVVSWTTMIVGYAKNGLLDMAGKLFHDMPEKNVVAWNAMIGSCVQANLSFEALELFREMQLSNMKPDKVTMLHCLSACSQLGALDTGMWTHNYIKKHNLSLDVALGTALIDMYAKCGNMTKALQVFNEMPRRNSLTWTAIIGGLALYGNVNDAIFYFSKMIDSGLMPDEITFLGVLTACCHGGLVEEGRKYFDQMKSRFNLSPQPKHYSCMVNLLGRAGLLEEAEELIKTMPMEADAMVWGALFFACGIHRNLLIGERAASKLLDLDPHDSGIYVLLANMYREAGKWEEAQNIRKMMMERGVEKTPGSSSIEAFKFKPNGILYIRCIFHMELRQQLVMECFICIAC
ncbi:pentatricopeptide repeat-containing protein At2g22410, mitochondrial isoform X2 [Populus trichocarpa]|uniref:Pentacotripeptide-repeat region of PRORP domain-containing protein n=1 Tax=Populus trichocarpa TaxID=3694 RepID=A0A3N7EGG3_POPTR|nr:pentatricopeptide repeat-containing protein At2g22410, mitochondrial isoform X2 [Populus trichocarpa]|eukprot:XP_024462782.1 pentatricopeptide repeat-containing protein At2g22410, mitochondrial isoform X2 [Populus trichocarpa]